MVNLDLETRRTVDLKQQYPGTWIYRALEWLTFMTLSDSESRTPLYQNGGRDTKQCLQNNPVAVRGRHQVSIGYG